MQGVGVIFVPINCLGQIGQGETETLDIAKMRYSEWTLPFFLKKRQGPYCYIENFGKLNCENFQTGVIYHVVYKRPCNS
jgi:hypothetical protein